MKCHNCNTNNEDNLIFCKNCGERLVDTSEELKINSSENKNSNTSSSNSANSNASKSNTQKKLKGKDFFGRAFCDVRNTNKVVKNTFLLGLLNAIPILNFVVTGLAQNWGYDDLNKNAGNELPRPFVSKKNFVQGFYEFLTVVLYGLVWFLAFRLVDMIFDKVPVIDTLVSIVLICASFIWFSIVCYAAQRSKINNTLSNSFGIKKIFKTWKSGGADLFLCYFVPLVVCFSFVLLLAVFILFAFLPSIVTLWEVLNYVPTSYFYTNTNALTHLNQFLPSIGSLSFSVILLLIVSGIFGTFEKLWRYRAISYWIKEYEK